MHELFDRLRALNLRTGDYAIFGSGPLIVRNWIQATNDLDVICRGTAWSTVTELGDVSYNGDYGVELVSMLDGRMTFGRQWGIGDPDIDELIDTAEILDDLPFVQLEHVVRYKQLRNSDKDRLHLEILKRRYAGDGGLE